LTAANPYYLGNRSKGQFILGYVELNEQQIEEGIYKLSQALLDACSNGISVEEVMQNFN